jgi:hypothetical protein
MKGSSQHRDKLEKEKVEKEVAAKVAIEKEVEALRLQQEQEATTKATIEAKRKRKE